MSGFSCSSIVTSAHYATLILKIKASTSYECKYQIILTTLLVFVNASEDSIMVDGATTPSNLLIAQIKEE
jgi:hypothetical protein